MKLSMYTLILLGVTLASLAFVFEKPVPWLASIFALTAAFIFIKAANRLRENKKHLKIQNNKTSKRI